MSLPSHVLLPLSGAVVLAAAVIGTWLWPAPTVPPLKLEPPPLATPAVIQPPAPPPSPAPRPSRPVTRPAPPPPPIRPVAPPRPVASAPVEPLRGPPAPSYPQPQVNAPPQEQKPPTGPQLTMVERAASLLERGIAPLEKARDEALARGDHAEWQRLDTSIRQHRERLERTRTKSSLSQAPNGGEMPRM